MDNLIKMDDFGVPLVLETPTYIYIYILLSIKSFNTMQIPPRGYVLIFLSIFLNTDYDERTLCVTNWKIK